MESMPSSFSNNNKLDYKELIRPYLRHWKWFAFSAMIALVLAFLSIRYSTPEYAVQSEIQIIQDQSSSSEMTAFRDLNLLGGSNNTQVSDEIEILNSRANHIEVVKQLGLNIKIMTKGRIYDAELYPNPPFKLNFLIPDSLVYNSQGVFILEVLSETTFSLANENDDTTQIYSFGNTIDSEIGDFVIIPNPRREAVQMFYSNALP